MPVLWEPQPEHNGRRLAVSLGQGSMSGFKLVSMRLVELFLRHDAAPKTFDVDIRLRGGEPAEGHLGSLKAPDHQAGSRLRAATGEPDS